MVEYHNPRILSFTCAAVNFFTGNLSSQNIDSIMNLRGSCFTFMFLFEVTKVAGATGLTGSVSVWDSFRFLGPTEDDDGESVVGPREQALPLKLMSGLPPPWSSIVYMVGVFVELIHSSLICGSGCGWVGIWVELLFLTKGVGKIGGIDCTVWCCCCGMGTGEYVTFGLIKSLLRSSVAPNSDP